MARFKTWRIGVLNKDSLLSVWCQFAMFQIANLSGDSLLGAELLLLFFLPKLFLSFFRKSQLYCFWGKLWKLFAQFYYPSTNFQVILVTKKWPKILAQENSDSRHVYSTYHLRKTCR